jgi:hypothetical protein
VYYNVQRLKLKVSPPTTTITTPSITVPAKKRAGPRLVARVKPGALFDTALVRELVARGFDAALDPTIAGDVDLPGGVGVRIITTADAEEWDAETTRSELPGVEHPVLAIWQEDKSRAVRPGDQPRGSATSGAVVISFADIGTLASIIASMRAKQA